MASHEPGNWEAARAMDDGDSPGSFFTRTGLGMANMQGSSAPAGARTLTMCSVMNESRSYACLKSGTTCPWSSNVGASDLWKGRPRREPLPAIGSTPTILISGRQASSRYLLVGPKHNPIIRARPLTSSGGPSRPRSGSQRAESLTTLPCVVAFAMYRALCLLISATRRRTRKGSGWSRSASPQCSNDPTICVLIAIRSGARRD